jgi:type I restriction enzyme S subunit
MVISSTLEEVSLLEVCDFYSGKAHEHYVTTNGKYKIINSKFVATDGEVFKESNQSFLTAKKNDITMVMSDLPNGRALAKCFLVDQEDKYAVNQRVCILRSKGYDPKYLYYVLNRNPYFLAFNDGVSQTHLLNHVFEKCKLMITKDVVEQKAIAEALSDIDELISSLKLELNKKALLLDALRCELMPNNFLNSNLPVGWEVKRLGDVGNITGAGVDKVIRTDDKFVQLVNYMDVYRNLFVDEKIVFMSTTATQSQIQNCDLIEGDVLFTPTSETPEDIAQSAAIKGNLKNCLYSYHLVRFRPKITFNVEYLAHCFNLADFKRQTLRAAEGSGTRYVITLPRFRNLEFPFPDLAEQERIGKCLSEAAEEVSNAKMLLTKYLSVKQGMMNDLLTGKVRLV